MKDQKYFNPLFYGIVFSPDLLFPAREKIESDRTFERHPERTILLYINILTIKTIVAVVNNLGRWSNVKTDKIIETGQKKGQIRGKYL
ncbi:hypothetical protein V9K67_10050 [Paraflavisolibacter sp. H34]|uniref:hypothetical protein n=1 Tax=Huijunlia imazamoxiresistens TaxID=3127457 RepID=UPI003015FFD7